MHYLLMNWADITDYCIDTRMDNIYQGYSEWYPGGLQISFHIDLPDF